MDPINKVAFDVAKEIVVANLTSGSIRTGRDTGELVADFFEAIYDRVLKIAQEAEVK